MRNYLSMCIEAPSFLKRLSSYFILVFMAFESCLAGAGVAPSRLSGSNAAALIATKLPGVNLGMQTAASTAQTLQITASDPDGTGTGTARLGVPVNITTAISQPTYPVRTWSLNGAGSFASSNVNNENGVYTPPSTMPANPVVILTCILQGAPPAYPTVKKTYTITLVNPVPKFASISSGNLTSGAVTPVRLNGTGFVPGTVISSSVGTATSSYLSPASMNVWVNLAAGTTGNVSLKARNPGPGGGTSSSFSVPILSLQLTASDSDGTNTRTARLGSWVNFTTTVQNSPWGVRVWNLQGAGTLQSTGNENYVATYTPPMVMPANPNVTISTSLVGDPTATASYSFTLVNPIPAINSGGVEPTELLAGGTQNVVLTGSGYLPGRTVAIFNGTHLPVTVTNFYRLTVPIPVPTIATGNLSLQLYNPGPGGGLGSTFKIAVAPVSIALTATDQDGTNTGTAELGAEVAMTANVAGTEEKVVNWSLSNTSSGSISSSGVYTAPTVLPQNTRVTIIGTLRSSPSVTATYVLNIINPKPEILGCTQNEVWPNTMPSVTFTGRGFVPGTVVLVNSVATPTTYISSTSIKALITVPSGATGSLSVQAYTGIPGGGHGDSFQLAIDTPVTQRTAARILDQTTFGPTTGLIQQVTGLGVNAWLTQQFNTPQTVLKLPSVLPSVCGDAEMCVESQWWDTVLTGNDQLRQRVAFALSEMLVVSSDTLSGQAIDYYRNLLATDAFTNWYQIMNDVTLSPAMGIYLDMVESYKPTGTLIADENYARENMQLFNLGLDLINQDGSLQLDGNGNPIPTYTEAEVQAFARAYTGWTFANPDGSTPSDFIGVPNYYHPMVAVDMWHDENRKTLLRGTTLPAGQTAEEDLAGALNNVFQHPNLPPFVSRQLIQHLVKSDPSPAYISRVAAVFINDGNNVRGDMQAVLTAIFTDPEARIGDTSAQASDGHLREPILWLTGAMRGLGYVNVDPKNFYQYLSNYSGAMGEWPYQSPAVFNFFPPSYVIPGTALNAPEFGLENTASVTVRLTQADQLVNNRIMGFNVDLSATSPLGQIAVLQGPSGLVNALNALFLYNTMDANTVAAITNEISSVANPAQQVRLAAYLVLTSSEYKILH
jgi:uncharacterized protein (DUF1800 family)